MRKPNYVSYEFNSVELEKEFERVILEDTGVQVKMEVRFDDETFAIYTKMSEECEEKISDEEHEKVFKKYNMEEWYDVSKQLAARIITKDPGLEIRSFHTFEDDLRKENFLAEIEIEYTEYEKNEEESKNITTEVNNEEKLPVWFRMGAQMNLTKEEVIKLKEDPDKFVTKKLEKGEVQANGDSYFPEDQESGITDIDDFDIGIFNIYKKANQGSDATPYDEINELIDNMKTAKETLEHTDVEFFSEAQLEILLNTYKNFNLVVREVLTAIKENK